MSASASRVEAPWIDGCDAERRTLNIKSIAGGLLQVLRQHIPQHDVWLVVLKGFS